MCELLAMSSRYPATVRLSLQELAQRGGATGPHRDGWGIAYYAGRDARLIKEPAPASDSACVRFIEGHDLRSPIVISHIRKATHGEAVLHNTQPFARELGGRLHVFAHNGDLGDAYRALEIDRWRPIGDTDSEHAFCSLLERLAPLWQQPQQPPAVAARLEVLAGFAAALRPMGPANFIYSDADVLFVHGDRRHQADGQIRPPGVWRLARSCPVATDAALDVPGVSLRATTEASQQVVLAASVPLTDEGWEPIERGAVLALRGGEIVAEA